MDLSDVWGPPPFSAVKLDEPISYDDDCRDYVWVVKNGEGMDLAFFYEQATAEAFARDVFGVET